jgi:hypothetical protein
MLATERLVEQPLWVRFGPADRVSGGRVRGRSTPISGLGLCDARRFGCPRVPARCRGDRIEAARVALPIGPMLDFKVRNPASIAVQRERSENWNK